MFALPADYRKLLQIALTLGAALLVLAAIHFPAQAAPVHRTIVIPASDGYGFDDCLGKAESCGKIIADAWCEAHGMATAVSFSRADDVTGTFVGSKPTKFEPGSFVVECSDASQR